MTLSKFLGLSALSYCIALWNVAAAETTNEALVAFSNRPPVTLTQALGTNVVGTYKLEPVWTGKCEVVVATGIFRNPERPVFATNRYKLKFDMAVVTPKKPVGHVGPKGIARFEKDGGYTALYTVRDSLPVNAELGLAESVAGLIQFLGPPQGFPPTTGQGSDARNRLNWRFFKMSGDTNVETLEVTAIVEKRASARDAHIDSLEVLRGQASPEIKPAKK